MVHGKGHQPRQALRPLTVKASTLPSRSVTAVSGHRREQCPVWGPLRLNENRTGRQQSAEAKGRGALPRDPGPLSTGRGRTERRGPAGGGPGRFRGRADLAGAHGQEDAAAGLAGRRGRGRGRGGPDPRQGGPARPRLAAAQSRQTAKHSERTLGTDTLAPAGPGRAGRGAGKGGSCCPASHSHGTWRRQ